MDRGLYLAASGMLVEQLRQDQIANDLANASTPGYKADRVTQKPFGTMLLQSSATGAVIGAQSTSVAVDKITTDFTPQPARDTGNPLDFAVVGQGFFAVQTAQGVRYTRDGQFSADSAGRLVDAMGNPVLARGGSPARVGADGTVDPRQLEVVNLSNAAKQGDNLVTGTPAGGPTGQVRSGALEESGADATRAMVDMITAQRTFESGQKAIQTIDETLQKSAASVGNVTGA